jgi:hypothetical protein
MTTQTPATPGQPRDNPRAALPTVPQGRRRPPTRSSRLGRGAWWCLAAWPVLFITVVLIAQQVYPEGAADPNSPSGGAAFGVVAAVLLFALPLTSLVLSTVDFHRTRSWRSLAPAWILLVLVGLWDVMFASGVANWSDVNWWVFTPTAVVIAVLVAGIFWPKSRTGIRH